MSKRRSSGASAPADGRLQQVLFWICGLLLALVPLVFTTAVYRTFILPKFVVLIVGSSAILFLLSVIAANDSSRRLLGVLKSRYVALVFIYFLAVATSTLLGVEPLASLFGSYQNEMGLISRLCFFILFVGLVVAVGNNSKRLLTLLWIMASVGLIVAAYAAAQFVGRDPFLPAASYTFSSPSGPVVRVNGTLGHSNYLGNFLLYTTPIAAALAIASRGRPRRFALAAAALSIAAIIFSGARGAWVGLLAGVTTFAVLELSAHRATRESARQGKRIRAAVAAAMILIAAIVIIASSASSNISARVRSFASDRLTGSGRMILWRDSAHMLPAFALIGCGPEGFSRTFLAYKSRELAMFASTINNESSHNSYLDAAICFGIPGALAYLAMIVIAFRLLLKSRRGASDPQTRFVVTGLISSLTAVCVHNFFIYDQIPTGLYFFALMALASVASNVTINKETPGAEPRVPKRGSHAALNFAARTTAAFSLAVVVAAVWFSTSLAIADSAMKRSSDSVSSDDFEGMRANGQRATRSMEATGAYDFLFARLLAAYAERTPRAEESNGGSGDTGRSTVARRSWALGNARAHALKSLAHTLTPESNYVLLAYIELLDGNIEKLHAYASQAIQWDPNFYNARWLMAEALLAEGDNSGAAREAQISLQLRPDNRKALSALARARGDTEFADPKLLGLVEHARSMWNKGKTAKAQELLLKAIQFSNAACPVCHRELALLYEETNQREKAITEWQEFTREAPERAAAEKVAERIEALKGR
ncbi:MAG TPA: O-antigen ligase family protein [Blastocatellia bacterium]|nr:O-antigen ligase family protein [Blastocatellia bacterium]